MEILSDIEKYLCVICQEILTDPVTLPCFHTCCLTCLEKTLDCNKYQCFLCRKFIGSWYRNARKRNELINRDLLSVISKNLSNLIQKKLSYEVAGVSATQFLKISHPGEIKAEFDTFLQKIEGEKLAQQEKENKLSEEFIHQLEEAERKLKFEQEEILKCDELIARELASEINADLKSTEKNTQIQLSTDEELAKKLSMDEEFSQDTSFRNLKTRIISKPDKKLIFVKASPLNKSKCISPKAEKTNRKISTSVRFGPMDKFVGSVMKKSTCAK